MVRIGWYGFYCIVPTNRWVQGTTSYNGETNYENDEKPASKSFPYNQLAEQCHKGKLNKALLDAILKAPNSSL